MDDSRTRRLAVEISCFETYRYAQLQNRELKTELIRVNFRFIFHKKDYVVFCFYHEGI